MKRDWDLQYHFNAWFSLGIHIDHQDPSVTFHLPFCVLSIGRLIQPGYTGRWDVSLRRWLGKTIDTST